MVKFKYMDYLPKLMAIEASLEKLGLSKQEAEVYVNTLKLGVAKASEIAQKSKVKREACYYILKLLQEKGFISEVIKSGVKHYSALNPKSILNLIEEEKREKSEAIKEALPELESMQRIALTRPKIEVYEGVEGFKTIVSKLIEKENREIYAYVPENTLHFLPTFHLQFRRRRKEMKVNMKVITERTPFMEDIKNKDKEEIRETRFNSKIMRNINSAYFILQDAVVIIKANEKEQLGIYIKEESTAKLQKNIFEQIWKESEK
jgi:sugar-specific transcriptional regulator TrmB